MKNKGRKTYWNKENCLKVVLNCVSKSDFEKKYSGAYKSCLINKWMTEVCSNLPELKKINNYWVKSKCQEAALNCKSKTEFFKLYRGAYKSALKNGWLNEICQHMKLKGSLYKRHNYVYEFPDKHVYVGLTCNIDRRNNEHLTNLKSPVFKHIQDSGLTPKLIYDELKPVEKTQIKEGELIDTYRKNGWILLNKAKAGGLGTCKSKWDINKCQKEALKYKTRLEFQKLSHSAYRFALRNKLINKICTHMINITSPKKYWGESEAQEEALRYRTRTQFKKSAYSAYNFCLKNNLLDTACLHMIKKINKNIPINEKWSRELCKLEALKYNTKKDFYTNSQNAYRFSIRKNFLNEICGHMINNKNS
jgi:hypothetical protein